MRFRAICRGDKTFQVAAGTAPPKFNFQLEIYHYPANREARLCLVHPLKSMLIC